MLNPMVLSVLYSIKINRLKLFSRGRICMINSEFITMFGYLLMPNVFTVSILQPLSALTKGIPITHLHSEICNQMEPVYRQ